MEYKLSVFNLVEKAVDNCLEPFSTKIFIYKAMYSIKLFDKFLYYPYKQSPSVYRIHGFVHKLCYLIRVVDTTSLINLYFQHGCCFIK